ncbi:hypothetical protein ACGGAQ_04085 [Micromonospora sp. NPDC047557]
MAQHDSGRMGVTATTVDTVDGADLRPHRLRVRVRVRVRGPGAEPR